MFDLSRWFDIKCIYASLVYHILGFVMKSVSFISIMNKKFITLFQKRINKERLRRDNAMVVQCKSSDSNLEGNVSQDEHRTLEMNQDVVTQSNASQHMPAELPKKLVHLGFILDAMEFYADSHLLPQIQLPNNHTEISKSSNVSKSHYKEQSVQGKHDTILSQSIHKQNNIDRIILTENESLQNSTVKHYASKLMNTVEWCVEYSTIQRITYYDLKGISQFIFSYLARDDRFQLVSQEENEAHWVFMNKLHIHTFNYQSHSHPKIIDFVKYFYEKEQNNMAQMDLSKFEEQKKLYFQIYSELESFSHQTIPKEPDLIIILSKVPILFGYNPNFLRYAEIIHHERGIDIQHEDFQFYLRNFEQVEHRFGK